MRVALALDAHGGLSRHFGHSSRFMVYELEKGEQVGQQARDNPHKGEGHGHATGGHGDDCEHEHEHEHEHKRGAVGGHGRGLGRGTGRSHGWVARALGDCDVVIAGGMGEGAKEALRAGGVRPIVVEERLSPDRTLELFTEGKL